MNLMLFLRGTALGSLCLIAVANEHASGQCAWWDRFPGFYASSGVRALRVVDVGSGPQLFVARDQEVAKWTGASWVWAGNEAFDDLVFCVGSYDSGAGPELYAGGQFSATVGTNTPAFRLAKLVNGAWVNHHIPASAGLVHALAVFDDGLGPKLYVGGGFPSYSSINSDSIVSWNGAVWAGVGGGLTGVPPNSSYVGAMCVYDDGTGSALYVGGQFLMAGGVAANHIARWDGTTWSPLGSGVSIALPGWSPFVNSLAVFDDGAGPALYVGGIFDHAGGVSTAGIAKWDGATWSALPGLSATPIMGIQSVTAHDDGNGPALYIGTNSAVTYIGQAQFRGVARWDGQAWSSLGGGFSGAFALESFDDGHGAGPALWVGGNNSQGIGGNIPSIDVARWYGGCTHGIDPMCFGDGTFAQCPCANYGSSLHGCANSASTQGALLSAAGTTTPDTLVLQSSFEPATCLSIFVQSSSLLPVQLAFGDGILCLGGQLRRLFVKTSSAGTAQAPEPGDISITQQSAAFGDPIAPGSVRFYQVWYRDGDPGFCPPGSLNISNGLRVVW